jgi:phosphoribosylamine--glycine ligase
MAEMEKLRVLLLGSGGREHALAWKISQSPMLDALYVAPGNGGTDALATNLNIDECDFEAIKSAVLSFNINLVVVGPEAPLVKGIRDFFEHDPVLNEVKLVGPNKEAAQMEGSKSFSKQFMQRHGIPTAAFGEFNANELEQAKAFLDAFKPPYVLKADGLAAGKGVLILDDRTEAENALTEMLQEKKFGTASEKVVIEEFLSGIELSVFILTDGKNHVLLPEAKDYKRIGEGDQGLNTGGMGSISPVPFADEVFMNKVQERIIKPTIQGWKKDNMAYNGFLFIGLMNVNGEPYVIEYNCRMGDPETESVIPRINSDLLALLWKCGNEDLLNATLEVNPKVATCIMLVSGGYPEAYEKGMIINGASINVEEDTALFHAGTKIRGEELVTNGGRVMAISALAENRADALAKCYELAATIHFDKMYYRKDIGYDL